MRNFKKFLALVLAMLMVSACAIGVSAKTFKDQSAIEESGYAEAVGILTDLGVMQGKGDDTFDPNGILTRAETAVIIAKLYAGSNGANIKWDSAKECVFDDVTAEWAFGYINYCAQRGLMDGVGDGKFNPDGTLSLAEAVTAVAKAAKLSDQVAALSENKTFAWWATPWMTVAEDNGLLANISEFDYTVDCTRATMAQVAYNLFNNEEITFIYEGFGMAEFTGKVAAIVGNTLKLVDGADSRLVDLTTFNNAMKAANVEGTAADYEGAYFSIIYSNDKQTVYGVSLESAVLKTNYTENKLVANKDAQTISIDGVVYNFNGLGSIDDTVIGGVTSSNGVFVEGLGETLTTIPAYYTAVAFDDDADGKYDRLYVEEYVAGKVAKADKAQDNDGTADGYNTVENVKYEIVSIYDMAGTLVKSWNDKNVVFAGQAYVDAATPVLYRTYTDVTGNDVIEILMNGVKASGKLTKLSKTQVTIDGAALANAGDFTVIDTNFSVYLNQTVTYYTLDGKFVNFLEADTASEVKVFVNNVVLKGGKALITGYDLGNNFADIEFRVLGINNGSRLVDKGSFEASNVWYYKDANDASTYTQTKTDGYTEKKFAGQIYMADKVDATKIVTFEEGNVYTFTKTADGVYYDLNAQSYNFLAQLDAEADAEDATRYNCYITANRIYATKDADTAANKAVAIAKTNNPLIVEKVVPAATDKNAYAMAYNKLAALNQYKEVDFVAYKSIAEAVAGTDLVYGEEATFIYVNRAYTPSVTTFEKLTGLAEGESIVQLVEKTGDMSYDSETWVAVDIIAGKKVNVEVKTESSVAIKAGLFYTVKNGVVEQLAVDGGYMPWVGELTVTEDTSDPFDTYFKAGTTYLKRVTGTSSAYSRDFNDEAAIGIDYVKYVINDNGTIAVDDQGNAVKDTEFKLEAGKYEFAYYVAGGTLIIID